MIWSWLACQTGSSPTHEEDPVRASLLARPLELTAHAECRMACRKFDRSEVEGVLRDGSRAPERDRANGECPTYGFEGRTRDDQRARMIFAGCSDETRLVTAIDLDTDWPCNCF